MSEIQKGQRLRAAGGRERERFTSRDSHRERPQTTPAVTGETSDDSRARVGVQLLRPPDGSGFCSSLEWPDASLQ